MKVIYEPKGKAKEYCDLAANLYRGCSHGCSYCYAPSALFMAREEFAKPMHRNGLINALKKEVHKYAGREIHLCFTCDAYQNIGSDITREAIEIIISAGAYVRILTKAGMNSIGDFDILNSQCWYGATLTFINDNDSVKWEPEAALPASRMNALKKAYEAGIKTWVSIEPVIDTYQSLSLIEKSIPYVDEYKIGKWNHDKRAKEIDWRTFGNAARNLLDKHNKSYIIKKDLLSFMD